MICLLCLEEARRTGTISAGLSAALELRDLIRVLIEKEGATPMATCTLCHGRGQTTTVHPTADEIQALREARDGFEVAAEMWQKVAEDADAPPFPGPVIRDHTGRWHRALLVAHRERPGEWCWQPVPELHDGDS